MSDHTTEKNHTTAAWIGLPLLYWLRGEPLPDWLHGIL